jgi:hypothetical protein
MRLHTCFAGERLHMVRRWSSQAAVDWRIASRMLDLHRRVGVTPVLQASCGVCTESVLHHGIITSVVSASASLEILSCVHR